jgi:hypothetical protein
MKLKFLENNFLFYILLILIISLSTILNFNANVMGPMNVLYEEFIHFFQSEFNYGYNFKYSNYTFPMWGYGLILYLFPFKIYIIIFQQIITFLTIVFLDKTVKRNKLFSSLTQFRLGLLFSFTLYFFHSSVYPYSLGSNFLVLGILFIINFYFNKSKLYIILSSVFFGLMLNLRSDYYLFIYLLFFLFIALSYHLYNKKIFLLAVLWIVIIQIFLFPWRWYTFNRTGEILSTSTNSGHVFFISLGQLPNNIWGITEEDDDPVMYSYLNTEFPNQKVYSLSHQENKFLLKKFIELIKNNPLEFIKKCGYNTYRLIRTPLYTGNLETLFNNGEFDNIEIKNQIKFYLNSFDFINLFDYIFFNKGRIYIVSGIINLFSILFFAMFLIQFFRFNLRSIFKFNFINYLLGLIYFYQIALSVFAFHMPIYNMNIYLFYLLGLFYYTNKLNSSSKQTCETQLRVKHNNFE